MAEHPRLFTLAEAVALLADVRARIHSMRDTKRRLETARDRLATLMPAMRGNGKADEAQELEQTLAATLATLRSQLEELQRQGVELKDLDSGLCDFPSLRDGRVVYLCWLIDEPTITHWHELDDGFAGRQPL